MSNGHTLFPTGEKHFEMRVDKWEPLERAPPSASVSPGPPKPRARHPSRFAKAPTPAPKQVHSASALCPPAQGPHLEPTAPQEARLVHRRLVRNARLRPAPPQPAKPRHTLPLAKPVS